MEYNFTLLYEYLSLTHPFIYALIRFLSHKMLQHLALSSDAEVTPRFKFMTALIS